MTRTNHTNSSVALNTIKLFCRIIKRLAPPPKLTISEWADQYRILSKESSAEAGKWRTDRAEYQREIMDAISDPIVEKVVMMTSAQVGKSELINNTLGYYIDYNPAPILLVFPTIDEAKYYSKERLNIMLRDTPALRGKVKDNTTKDSDNTILHKAFPGGNLKITGANAPAGLAGKPTQVLLCDEIDRWPLSAGREGDPLNLAEKRTNNFWNRKKVLASTPTIEGESRIEIEYQNSSQEKYYYKCPDCGKEQPLSWQQIRFQDDDYKYVTHECNECFKRFGEFEWKAEKGRWVAHKKNLIIRGFHLNELYSPWRRWETIVEEFKKAESQGPEFLKVWINTSLGEVWREKGTKISENKLLNRRETYISEVPEGVLLITVGVDVQANRLEAEAIGWGLGKETWGIERKFIYGDPKQSDVWKQLDIWLDKEFKYQDNYKIKIACTCVDSGYLADEVYSYVHKRQMKRVFAVKGVGGAGKNFLGKISKVGREREKVNLFPLGVDTGKEIIYSNLKIEEPGPGYCHFPQNEEKLYNQDFFKGLTSEKRIIKYENRRPKIAWVLRSGITRNEPLDIRNYAMAAFEILNPSLEDLANKNKNDLYNLSASNKTPKKRPRRRIISKGIS